MEDTNNMLEKIQSKEIRFGISQNLYQKGTNFQNHHEGFVVNGCI